MKKKIEKTLIEEINLSYIDCLNLEMYDNTIDRSKIDKVLGCDTAKRYFNTKNAFKEKIIKALNECDDFDIEEDYLDNSTSIRFFKIEVESDYDYEKRKVESAEKRKKSAEKRKKKKEDAERLEYERLKKKYGNEESK